jgi:hypothetical protein
MIRYIKYLFLAALGLCLVIVALANREMQTFRLLPDGLADLVGANWVIELPLFVMIFAGIAGGLLIGFVWEWLRETKHRMEAERQKTEAKKLSREVRRLKTEQNKGKDDVLALLDETG